MDKTDFKILQLLQKNARESASSIGKEIHLSVSAVIERIRKMEENGIIQSYTIIVNEQKTGNALTALMEVRLDNPRYLDGFTAAVCDMDPIVSCYYITGEFDLMLKIACASSDELERIHRSIMNLDGVRETRTHVVLKNLKNSHSVIRRPDQEM